MRKRFQKSFAELVKENKQEIMQDKTALIKIENKIDQKYDNIKLQKA